MKHIGTNRGKLGPLGEEIAGRFLCNRGYEIVETNYRKSWGEIDIVSKKDGVMHFVEVKATSGWPGGDYRPEENVHPKKLERLVRAIETYLAEKRWEGEWVIDVAGVFIDMDNKKAVVRITENVTL